MSRLQGTARADSSRPVLGAVVLLSLTLLGAAGLKSWRDLTAARGRERQLETRIEETRNGIEQLRSRIDRLKSDPAMLERLAREDLGLVLPRDVVIELPKAGVAAGDLAGSGPAAAAPAPAAPGTGGPPAATPAAPAGRPGAPAADSSGPPAAAAAKALLPLSH